MIEVTILDYLAGALGVPAYMELPPEAPESCLVLEKTGSGERDRLQEATIAVQSYGPTLYAAAELNQAVKAAMSAARDSLENVFRAECGGDYNFTDTRTKRYRYQAVFNIDFLEG